MLIAPQTIAFSDVADNRYIEYLDIFIVCTKPFKNFSDFERQFRRHLDGFLMAGQFKAYIFTI
jgi:hypothetical protein